MQWLPADALLVGHNAKAFDSRVLMFHIIELGVLEAFRSKTVIFADTLPLLKEVLPNRRAENKSFRQCELVSDILHESYEAHDALKDAKSLQRRFTHLDISNPVISRHSFSVEMVLESIQSNTRIDTFKGMENVVSKEIVRRMASSGLEISHLFLAFRREGEEGLKSVLTENINGKPRVTNNKRILTAIEIFVVQNI